MEVFILGFLETLPTPLLFVIILGTLYTLSKGADLLVEEAVRLSILWRIPKVLIGATIVSLGTTPARSGGFGSGRPPGQSRSGLGQCGGFHYM